MRGDGVNVNKVAYGGRTLIDLTSDTVTPQTLVRGATAHAADGSIITGENPGASGDMLKSQYDKTGSVLSAGGIDAYSADAVYSDPAETTPETILNTTEEVLRKVYPVGAIYMSINSASPADLFGFGTWERVKDRFLLAAGDSYAAGGTGGEATHTLTIDEMPKHNHTIRWGYGSGSADPTRARIDANSPEAPWPNSAYTGGGEPHNNMPPYLTVYVWRRTA